MSCPRLFLPSSSSCLKSCICQFCTTCFTFVCRLKYYRTVRIADGIKAPINVLTREDEVSIRPGIGAGRTHVNFIVTFFLPIDSSHFFLSLVTQGKLVNGLLPSKQIEAVQEAAGEALTFPLCTHRSYYYTTSLVHNLEYIVKTCGLFTYVHQLYTSRVKKRFIYISGENVYRSSVWKKTVARFNGLDSK